MERVRKTTFYTGDGERVDRQMMGSKQGCAIQFWDSGPMGESRYAALVEWSGEETIGDLWRIAYVAGAAATYTERELDGEQKGGPKEMAVSMLRQIAEVEAPRLGENVVNKIKQRPETPIGPLSTDEEERRAARLAELEARYRVRQGCDALKGRIEQEWRAKGKEWQAGWRIIEGLGAELTRNRGENESTGVEKGLKAIRRWVERNNPEGGGQHLAKLLERTKLTRHRTIHEGGEKQRRREDMEEIMTTLEETATIAGEYESAAFFMTKGVVKGEATGRFSQSVVVRK